MVALLISGPLTAKGEEDDSCAEDSSPCFLHATHFQLQLLNRMSQKTIMSPERSEKKKKKSTPSQDVIDYKFKDKKKKRQK